MTVGFLTFGRQWRLAVFFAALAVSVAGSSMALAAPAQLPSPPSTIFGSINDADGPVAAGVEVQAYIGDKLCSTGGITEKTGDGDAQITAYAVDVDSDGQTPGCGTDGAAVTIKIGDKTAEQTAKWEAGPVRLDITFGDVTPVPIPTFTPTPPRPTGTPVTIGTQTPQATIPAGSPGAGSPVATLGGGVTGATTTAAAATSDSSGGFPLWGIVIIVVAALAVIGGVVGFVMARNRHDEGGVDDDDNTPTGTNLE